jgi:hypothetical protein
VYRPILAGLGVKREEMRNRVPSRKAAPDLVVPEASRSD